MTPDDGKAPSPRPLARWAIATLAMDAVLALALLRLPRALVVDSVDTRAPVTVALVADGHALFLRATSATPRRGTLVIVPPRGATRTVSVDIAARDELLCAVVRSANLQTRCDLARPDDGPLPARTARWMRAERDRWTPHSTAVITRSGSAVAGDQTTMVDVDGLRVRGRFGFRVERPWVELAGRRALLERDLSLDHAVLVRDPADRSPLFVATPDGARLPANARVEQRTRSVLSTLAGRVGELSIAGLIAWMCAQLTALVAARTRESSSVFWRRFLRWSAMLATFVTGALALAVLELSQAR